MLSLQHRMVTILLFNHGTITAVAGRNRFGYLSAPVCLLTAGCVLWVLHSRSGLQNGQNDSYTLDIMPAVKRYRQRNTHAHLTHVPSVPNNNSHGSCQHNHVTDCTTEKARWARVRLLTDSFCPRSLRHHKRLSPRILSAVHQKCPFSAHTEPIRSKISVGASVFRRALHDGCVRATAGSRGKGSLDNRRSHPT